MQDTLLRLSVVRLTAHCVVRQHPPDYTKRNPVHGVGYFPSLILALSTLLMFAFIVTPNAIADLTETDQVDLTSCFDALSQGWHQPSVEIASSILSRSDYTAADYESWFNHYFNITNRPFTDDLRTYLYYPVFGWFDDVVHLRLQMALINPMWAKGTAAIGAHPADLGGTLYNDPVLRESLMNVHVFFSDLAVHGIVDTTVRTTIAQQYADLFAAYPQFFSDATTIDYFAQPFAAMLRTQVWLSDMDMLPFTAARQTEIALTVTLQDGPSGKKRAVYDTHSVLLIDNNYLDDTQLTVIDSILNKIPAELRNLRLPHDVSYGYVFLRARLFRKRCGLHVYRRLRR